MTSTGLPGVIGEHGCAEGVGAKKAIYSHSIEQIVKNHEGWWAEHIGEYATKITFCPFCGQLLP